MIRNLTKSAGTSFATPIIIFWLAALLLGKLLRNTGLANYLKRNLGVDNYQDILQKAKFNELTITNAHALRAGSLPISHRDPFDRMLMAQAELEKLPIITYDHAFQTGLIQVIPSPN